MQFIDLEQQYARIQAEINANIQSVLESQKFINGPEVAELEAQLADFVGSKYCLGVSSGTDAILMGLMAIDTKPGDAVFVPSFTFIATAEVVALIGATPIFVDVDRDTFNMSAQSLKDNIEHVKNNTDLTPKAIIPVDLFGLPADYKLINPIAKEHNLVVIEDSAQGFAGAIDGVKAPSFGHIGTTSFFPAKPLGCYGDGGAVFTDDEGLYDIMKSLRVHGQGSHKYDNVRVGLTARLDTLQAAILLAKMEIYPDEIKVRDRVAERYSANITACKTPHVPDGYSSVWAQYTLQTNDRARFQEALKEHNIPTMVYYVKPMHMQPVFIETAKQSLDCPVSAELSETVFSLPMHPYLNDNDIDSICDVINQA